MGVANKYYSLFLKVNWAVITIVTALVVIFEIIWIRISGIPSQNTFWLSSVPIPFLAFGVAIFMWSISSFRKKRSLLTRIRLVFTGGALAITLLVTLFWLGH